MNKYFYLVIFLFLGGLSLAGSGQTTDQELPVQKLKTTQSKNSISFLIKKSRPASIKIENKKAVVIYGKNKKRKYFSTI